MDSRNNDSANNFTVDENQLIEPWPDVKGIIKNKFRKSCSKELLFKRLPIIKWAKTYRASYLYQDCVAGITVGLTAVPQGIAYAVVAGLDPQYGLYAELMASFIYCVLGSVRNVTIGPTAIMALMIQQYATIGPDFAILAAFLSGILIIILAVLNFGFLVQFISIPVTAGFITAAAVQIGSLQVKSLLGIPGKSSEFLEAWIHLFNNFYQTKLWDTLLGVLTMAFLFSLKKLGDVKGKKWSSAGRYISLARNAFAVLIGSCIAYFLTKDGSPAPFALTGEITSGFPPFSLPPMSTTVGNVTYNFIDMINVYGTSLISIPAIAMLEIIVVAKAFSKGKSIDATQELIALGFCNFFGSFVSSMPVTGSFTRTAVNDASGVRTPFGGIATGTIILLSIGFLTQSFQFIPKATLAAIIITAMIYMMEFKTAIVIWKSKRIDVIPFLVTFIACLWIGLELGICIGIIVNLMFILYATSRPNTDVYYRQILQHNICVIVPDQSLVFSSAAHLKHKVLKYSSDLYNSKDLEIEDGGGSSSAGIGDNSEINITEQKKVSIVIIDGTMIQTIDVTVAKILQSLVEDFKELNKTILFWNWKSQPIGVAWRLDRKLGSLFVESNTIDQLLINRNIDILIK